MGIGDNGIVAVGSDIEDTAFDTTKALVDEDSEIISIYYGADVTEEAAAKLAERIESAFDSVEVEVHNAGQPVYYYVISVE
jgi:dihydroxyacetone kinase-like predicted kinase